MKPFLLAEDVLGFAWISTPVFLNWWEISHQLEMVSVF